METKDKQSMATSKVFPVAQEELRIGKRKRTTGATRVSKRVVEREETVNEPITREEVEIHRVQINQFVDTALPVRVENDTTIMPVYEEVLEVQKRLLLKEEIHIRKIVKRSHTQQRVTLRKEEAAIEHVVPGEETTKNTRRKQ